MEQTQDINKKISKSLLLFWLGEVIVVACFLVILFTSMAQSLELRLNSKLEMGNAEAWVIDEHGEGKYTNDVFMVGWELRQPVNEVAFLEAEYMLIGDFNEDTNALLFHGHQYGLYFHVADHLTMGIERRDYKNNDSIAAYNFNTNSVNRGFLELSVPLWRLKL